MREILQWETLKREQVAADPAFDTRDPDAHQLQSLERTLSHRAACLGPGAGPAEVMNVLGPLKTARAALGLSLDAPAQPKLEAVK